MIQTCKEIIMDNNHITLIIKNIPNFNILCNNK